VVISQQLRDQIDAEMTRYPQNRGALLTALRLVQIEFGHIAPEAAAELAQLFGLHAIDVLEVVSFYNMLYDSPQPRHHVMVCTNLPCSLRGARGLLRQLEVHLDIRSGEATADGRIHLGHEECLGACGYAPMMRVDDRYHEGLDVDAAKRIVDALD
jgi:NADH:ubiquinone oxidoreductase subunit E